MARFQFAYAISAAAAVSLLAGCSGGNSSTSTPYTPGSLLTQPAASQRFASDIAHASVLPPRLQYLVHPGQRVATSGWVTPNATPHIYVSDFNNSTVTCYNEEGVQTGQITAAAGLLNPQGMTVHHGILYVANTGASNILEYKGCTTPIVKTRNDPKQYPVDVAVDVDGEVYASNIITTAGGPGSIVMYTPVGVNPGPPFGIAGETRNYFIAIDDAGNLYSTYQDAGGAGQTACYPGDAVVGASVGVPLAFPGGINIHINGNLVISDQGASIRTFAGGNCAGGWVENVPAAIPSGGNDWIDIALDGPNLELNRTDATALNANSIVYNPAGTADDPFVVPPGANAVLPIGVTNDTDVHD